jgi:hypothetical protein
MFDSTIARDGRVVPKYELRESSLGGTAAQYSGSAAIVEISRIDLLPSAPDASIASSMSRCLGPGVADGLQVRVEGSAHIQRICGPYCRHPSRPFKPSGRR